MQEVDPYIKEKINYIADQINSLNAVYAIERIKGSQLRIDIDNFAAWLYQMAHSKIDETDADQCLVSDVYGNVLDFFEDIMGGKVDINKLLKDNPTRKLPDKLGGVFYRGI